MAQLANLKNETQMLFVLEIIRFFCKYNLFSRTINFMASRHIHYFAVLDSLNRSCRHRQKMVIGDYRCQP